MTDIDILYIGGGNKRLFLSHSTYINATVMIQACAIIFENNDDLCVSRNHLDVHLINKNVPNNMSMTKRRTAM